MRLIYTADARRFETVASHDKKAYLHARRFETVAIIITVMRLIYPADARRFQTVAIIITVRWLIYPADARRFQAVAIIITLRWLIYTRDDSKRTVFETRYGSRLAR